MDDKLVTIGQFMNNVEAQFASEALTLEGIECFITDEHISSICNISGVFGGVKLQVSESDVERAKEVMKDY